ncbi:hypothetical protein AB0O75_36840 [Streptomyces sp. NPDC088921]|uniref:hypothetical protein n=1 Tax=unclassified Streptomyces TaxID=2593676 RepID=UPI003412F16E
MSRTSLFDGERDAAWSYALATDGEFVVGARQGAEPPAAPTYALPDGTLIRKPVRIGGELRWWPERNTWYVTGAGSSGESAPETVRLLNIVARRFWDQLRLAVLPVVEQDGILSPVAAAYEVPLRATRNPDSE